MSAVRLLALAAAWPSASAAFMSAEPQRRCNHCTNLQHTRTRNIGAPCTRRRRRPAMSLYAASPSAESITAAAPNNLPTATDTPKDIDGAPPIQPRRTLHLLSLPPKDDAYALAAEALVRDCWRWKDAALGDGRDYFVPRPRALRAFQSLFVGMEGMVTLGSTGGLADVAIDPVEVELKLPLTGDEQRLSLECGGVTQPDEEGSATHTFVVEECAALSNCARLDVMLVLRSDEQDNAMAQSQYTKEAAEAAARYAVAYNLQQQVAADRSNDKPLLQKFGLASWLDSTDGIALHPTSSLGDEQCKDVCNLAQRLVSLEGARPISTHLSLIAGGLAPRPNRPDREVIFRPYSSRDAHVLLQLKRTVEVISVLDENDDASGRGGRGRIKTLLDGALSAGKAARNERVVPEIVELKEYGSDGTPPAALAAVVAEAAIERAIEPSVQSCVAKLVAMEADTAHRIMQLRRQVEDLVASLETVASDDRIELRKMANKLLHAPTMQLREGALSGEDVAGVATRIEWELLDHAGGMTLQR